MSEIKTKAHYIPVRMDDVLLQKIKTIGRELELIKPNGEPNVSLTIRILIHRAITSHYNQE